MKKRFLASVLAVVIVCTFILQPILVAASSYIWPVPGHTSLSRGYSSSHRAIDINDSTINGADVVAAMSGTVYRVYSCGSQHYGSSHTCDGFGTGVVIYGDDGYYYSYAHMQANSRPSGVSLGSYVTAGTKIGKVGTTGNSTGPHLHFAVATTSRYWEPDIDPMTLFDGSGGGSESGASVTVTTSYAGEITETAAVLYGSVASTDIKVTETGMYLGTSSENMTLLGSDSVSTYGVDMWYSTSKYGRTLSPGITYYFAAYAKAGGKTYWGETKSFTTISPANSFSVAYYANGGSGAPAAQTASSTANTYTFVIPSTTPTRSGYSFAGWSESATASIPTYFPGENVTVSKNTSVDLYAVWRERLSVVKVIQCTRYVDLPERLIELFWEPADGMRAAKFTGGPYCKCPEYAIMSDGSIMYHANVNHQGTDTQMWFKYESDMLLEIYHTYGDTQWEMAHPHSGYKTCACGDWYYTGEVRMDTDCEECYPKTTTYSVYFDGNGGTGVPSVISKTSGQEYVWITLPMTTPTRAGYTFDGWDEDPTAAQASYKVGDSVYLTSDAPSAVLYAIWTLIPNIAHLVYDANGGTGAPPTQEAGVTAGPAIFVISSIEPTRAGCTFLGWSFDRYASKPSYMPGDTVIIGSDAVLYAVWKEESGGECHFIDVPADAWYKAAVDYVVENGLMNGVNPDTFRPEGTMTRAMLVTVLWRYAGEPVEGTNTFSDVPNGQWFTKAVVWAAKNGIVTGVSNGRFNPNGNVTREQMATILFRYAETQGIDTSGRATLNSFPDANKVSAWAKDALQWCVAEGVIGGSNGELLPQGNATRAQVATILMRFIENVVKG